MARLREVAVSPRPLDRLAPVEGEARLQRALLEAAELRRRSNRVVWNVSSTAVGGGVAEMLRPLLAYARGFGIDTRWLVIEGSAAFFRITKRLHNALHGEVGDGSPLGEAERKTYEEVLHENANELLALVHEGDVVLLHDPQTAGLAPRLERSKAHVVWRCHIGADVPNEQTDLGWRFLLPYLKDVPAYVFSRAQFVPASIERARTRIIRPSIDAFSPKNEDLDAETVRAILSFVGLVDPREAEPAPTFVRADGSFARVEHRADIIRLGPPPCADTPIIVQVSRWDRLKDPIGVMHGFARLVASGEHSSAQLLLAGPNVRAVADDPDGAVVLAEVFESWRALPHEVRRHVQLASLPTHDVEENAVIVNALQRHAAIVVQKSLKEGFGLTVTEAMWKARPVVASAVGGIQEQIEDGVHGLLVKDPCDLGAFADALLRLLRDPSLARKLGENARERVRDGFLGLRHLLQYAQLLQELEGAG